MYKSYTKLLLLYIEILYKELLYFILCQFLIGCKEILISLYCIITILTPKIQILYKKHCFFIWKLFKGSFVCPFEVWCEWFLFYLFSFIIEWNYFGFQQSNIQEMFCFYANSFLVIFWKIVFFIFLILKYKWTLSFQLIFSFI